MSPIQHPAQLFLVGDSDCDRWPKRLLPFVGKVDHVVSGHGGATLAEILPCCSDLLLPSSSLATQQLITNDDPVYVVVCAGENDLGNGLNLIDTKECFERLLSLIQSCDARLVFLGPKIEPWLVNDDEARRDYIRMSRCMDKCCNDHPHASHIRFVDCLTMFCGDTASLPGSLMGGRARADTRFFDADQLHLSDQGYQIWKKKVEESILSLMTD